MNRTEFIGTNLYYSQEFVDDMKINYNREIERLKEENKILKEYQESYRKEIDYWRIQFSNKEERIDKANKILQDILVVRDWEHEGRYRPVKNTTVQDVYRTIIKLNELLETPYRQNYGLLQELKGSEE